MRKLLAVLLSVGILLAWSQLQGILVRAQGGPQQPALDARYCADSNGDGELSISDAVTVLNYLFTGEATPYCIAQEQSAPFATREETAELRAELTALRAELTDVPRYYSGTYVGDGESARVLETGVPGRIRAFWIAGVSKDCVEASDCVFRPTWISSEMPPNMLLDQGHCETSLGGSTVHLLPGPVNCYNATGVQYVWFALTTSS